MNKLPLVARVLLGLIFAYSGLMGFLSLFHRLLICRSGFRFS